MRGQRHVVPCVQQPTVVSLSLTYMPYVLRFPTPSRPQTGADEATEGARAAYAGGGSRRVGPVSMLVMQLAFSFETALIMPAAAGQSSVTFADTPSPSLLKHLLKGEGVAVE